MGCHKTTCGTERSVKHEGVVVGLLETRHLRVGGGLDDLLLPELDSSTLLRLRLAEAGEGGTTVAHGTGVHVTP